MTTTATDQVDQPDDGGHSSDTGLRYASAILAEHFGEAVVLVPDKTSAGRSYTRISPIGMKMPVARAFFSQAVQIGCETKEEAEEADREYLDGDDPDYE